MPKGKRTFKKLLATVILASCVSLFLVNSCARYDPSLYPTGDVLRPGPEVRILAITEDNNIIVNESFMLWVDALKDEIISLRRELADCKGEI